METNVADDQYIDSSTLDRLLKQINYEYNDLDVQMPKEYAKYIFMPISWFLNITSTTSLPHIYLVIRRNMTQTSMPPFCP